MSALEQNLVPQQASALDDIPTFANRIRQKTGAYSDVDDETLVTQFVRKNPTYKSRVALPDNFKLSTRSTGYQNLDKLYEDAAVRHNINPDLLIEQGRKETRFHPDTVYGRINSPKGARGLGQFMPDTAREYGLRVDDSVDDRTDPVKSVDAQARMMRDLLDKHNNDARLALAAYNSGHNQTSAQADAAARRIPETRDYVDEIMRNLNGGEQSPTSSMLKPRPIAQPVSVHGRGQITAPPVQTAQPVASHQRFGQADATANLANVIERTKSATPVSSHKTLRQYAPQKSQKALDVERALRNDTRSESLVDAAIQEGASGVDYLGAGALRLANKMPGSGINLVTRAAEMLGFSGPDSLRRAADWLQTRGDEGVRAVQKYESNLETPITTSEKVFKGAVKLPMDVAQAAIATELGGPVVGFGALSGLQSAGQGQSAKDVIKETAKGALTGAIFRGTAPIASPVRRGIATGVGTFEIEKLFGSDDPQASQAAVTNALFSALGGRGGVAKVRTPEGETYGRVTVDRNGPKLLPSSPAEYAREASKGNVVETDYVTGVFVPRGVDRAEAPPNISRERGAGRQINPPVREPFRAQYDETGQKVGTQLAERPVPQNQYRVENRDNRLVVVTPDNFRDSVDYPATDKGRAAAIQRLQALQSDEAQAGNLTGLPIKPITPPTLARPARGTQPTLSTAATTLLETQLSGTEGTTAPQERGSEAISAPPSESKPIIRHSDPRIDGGEIVGRTSDGKLKVQNNEGGISVVQDPRRQGNREAAIIKPPAPQPASEPVKLAPSASVPAETLPSEAASTVDAATASKPEKSNVDKAQSQMNVAAMIENSRDFNVDPLQTLKRNIPSYIGDTDAQRAAIARELLARYESGAIPKAISIGKGNASNTNATATSADLGAGSVDARGDDRGRRGLEQRGQADSPAVLERGPSLTPPITPPAKGEHGHLIQGLFRSPGTNEQGDVIPPFLAHPSVRQALGLTARAPNPEKDIRAYNDALKQAKERLAPSVGKPRASHISPEDLRRWANERDLPADAMRALDYATGVHSQAQAKKQSARAEVEQRIAETKERLAKPTRYQQTGIRRSKIDENSSLDEYVRGSGGVDADYGNALYGGELKRLRNRESGSSGLVRSGGTNAEYMMDSANQAGYRDENGEEFTKVGDFLRAVENSAGGKKVYSVNREYDVEKEYYDKLPQEAKDEFAREMALLRDSKVVQLLTEVRDGQEDAGLREELYQIADEHNVSAEAVDGWLEYERAQSQPQSTRQTQFRASDEEAPPPVRSRHPQSRNQLGEPLTKDFHDKVDAVARRPVTEVIKGMKWRVRDNRIRLNPESYAALWGAFDQLERNRRGSEFQSFQGVFIEPKYVNEKLLPLLQQAANVYGRAGANLYRIAQDIKRANKNGIIFYTDKEAVAHEQHHQGSYISGQAGGDYSLLGRHSAPDRLYNSIPQKAHDYLTEHGYSKDKGVRVEEFYTHLADPYFDNKEFGLTDEEAMGLYYDYAKSLIRKNGRDIVKHFEAQDAKIIEQYRRARSEEIGARESGTTQAGSGESKPLERGSGQANDSPLAKSEERQIDSPEFKKWFGDSKVVDEDGKPLVVYHGTGADFEQFSTKSAGIARGNKYAGRSNFFFTDNPTVAGGYALADMSPQALQHGYYDRPNVRPVFLSFKNPLVIDAGGESYYNTMADAIKRARREGRDGVIVRNVKDYARAVDMRERQDVYVAFSPTQIKSATGNRGTFDSSDPNILHKSSEEIPEGLKSFRLLPERPIKPSPRISTRAGEAGFFNPFGKRTKPEEYASIVGAIRDVTTQNLSQLKKISPESYEAALQLAGTPSQVTAAKLRGVAVTQAMEKALRQRNRDLFISTLESSSLLQPITGTTAPATIKVGSRDFTTTTIRWGNKTYLMPKWLGPELQPFLTKESPPNIAKSIIGKINQFGLAGPLDAAFHATNLMGTLVGTTPFVGTDVVSKTIGNTPVTKLLTTVIQLARTDPMDAQSLADIKELARIGALPSRYGQESYSKSLAALTGGRVHRLGLGPTLSGPKGLDIRARLIMYRIAKEVNPKASDAEISDFVNQLGRYNKQLESAIARAAKGSNLAPFYTAGSAMLRNGVRIWTGTSDIPHEGQSYASRGGYRLAQQLSGGAIGLLAFWVIASLAYRGKEPWKDDKSNFLQIPLKDSDRHSALAKKIWGDNDKTAYIGLGFFSPLVERGGRALGLQGAYNTAMRGGSRGQMIESGAKDILNSQIHPFTTGPFTHSTVVAVSGREPYVNSLRDKKTGDFGLDLRKAEIKEAKPGLPTIGRNVLEGALDANPFIGNIAHNLGINRDEKQKHEDDGNKWLKTILDLGAPRLFKPAQDTNRARGGVMKEQKAIDARVNKASGLQPSHPTPLIRLPSPPKPPKL